MSGAPAQAAGPATKVRVALEYALEGDLRFLSHHDELRMITRALVRARWPLAYSHGYNPAPRLTLPLPRSLGVACAAQLAVVTLTEARVADELAAALRPALPAGCRVVRVWGGLRGTPAARHVTYEIELAAEDAARAAERLPRLTGAVLRVARYEGPRRPARELDIRPYLEQVVVEGNVLRLALHIDRQRTARPSEVLTVLGLPAETYGHRTRRGDVRWHLDSASSGDDERPHERVCSGEQVDQEDEDNNDT